MTALGLTTAGSYALSGLVDWGLALLLIGGGAAGAAAGIAAGRRLSAHKGLLDRIFAVMVIVIGSYVLVKGL